MTQAEKEIFLIQYLITENPEYSGIARSYEYEPTL